MPRRILVSSNCQTGGLAASLQVIFPKDEVRAIPIANFAPNGATPALAEAVGQSDVWVTSGNFDIFDQYPIRATNPAVKMVKSPTISFWAFQPDCTSLYLKESGKTLTPPYQSGIASWCYYNGIDVADCARMFNKYVFRDLGYFNTWTQSIRFLQDEFQRAGADFTSFMLRVKRVGNFMHTTNHPSIHALIRLAQILSLQMGAPDSVLDQVIDVQDGLTMATWPVYPDLGDWLNIPSSYNWLLFQNVRCNTLRDYLDFAYRNFESLGVTKDQIAYRRPGVEPYDRVLAPLVRKAA